MMDRFYWKTVYAVGSLTSMPPDVTYPDYDWARNEDGVFHNLQTVKRMSEVGLWH
jgi:hypothetical protein